MRISQIRCAASSVASTSAHVKSINDIQHLYYIHPTSPGSVFFLPKGTRIFSKLSNFMRAQMRKHGFSEVVTPQLFKKDLWQVSGHWDHYKEDMFAVSGGTEAEKEEFSLKPMNCPGHCLIFKSQERSFRELPIRFSDFSPLHRNEASGALTGLTRVRRFHQDDGHIFCRPDQVADEIKKSTDLVDSVYRVFGLKYTRVLSTRPSDFVGDVGLWDQAEAGLKEALGSDVVINDGDGAFYGPKIDYIVTDNQGRQHQAATIQLDFQLPRKFELSYDTETQQTEIPVMVHRAVLGSVERFFALLIDHYNGKWPFWLNPTQAVVIPVSSAHASYASDVAAYLSNPQVNSSSTDAAPMFGEEFDIEVWDQAETVGNRIRKAVQQGVNYIIVLGDQEVSKKVLSVRDRDGGKDLKTLAPDELVQKFRERLAAYS